MRFVPPLRFPGFAPAPPAATKSPWSARIWVGRTDTMPTTPKPWEKHKTVAALVRKECSGCRPGRHSPPHYCCDLNRPCVLLAGEGERCEKFERALLPVASREAAEDYARLCPGVRAVEDALVSLDGEGAARVCPRCGRPLPKRKRMCEECRRAARRESYRRQKRRQRRAVG